MSDCEKRELEALERLLEGEPPYPVGSQTRRWQDRRDHLRDLAAKAE